MISEEEVLEWATRRAPPDRSIDLYSRLMMMEEKLKAAGWPSMAPWWKTTLKDFYRAETKFRLVLRVGRRGGKSSTLCRVAVAEALWGAHPVPPGDTGEFAFISVKKRDSQNRLRTIEEILKVLGVSHRKVGDDIYITGKSIKFSVYTASFRTSVGMTLVGVVHDELARWRDDDMGSNPAAHILTSVRPALATMPAAKEFMSSSPWSTLDSHFEYFERGETEDQMVGHAVSWVANPTLTIERCRQLEPDEESFDREYRAIPMSSGIHTFFDQRAIEDSVLKGEEYPREPAEGEEVLAGCDFGFRSDYSALYIAHLVGGVYLPGDYLVLKPAPGYPLKPSLTCASFAKKLSFHGLKGVMADSHYRESIVEHLGEHEIAFIDAPMKVPNTFIRARTLFNQDRVRIPSDRGLISDLIETTSRPTPNGAVSIQLPRRQGGGHGDLVSALVLAIWQRVGHKIPRRVILSHRNISQAEANAYVQELLELQDPVGTGIRLSEKEWITID